MLFQPYGRHCSKLKCLPRKTKDLMILHCFCNDALEKGFDVWVWPSFVKTKSPSRFYTASAGNGQFHPPASVDRPFAGRQLSAVADYTPRGLFIKIKTNFEVQLFPQARHLLRTRSIVVSLHLCSRRRSSPSLSQRFLHFWSELTAVGAVRLSSIQLSL